MDYINICIVQAPKVIYGLYIYICMQKIMEIPKVVFIFFTQLGLWWSQEQNNKWKFFIYAQIRIVTTQGKKKQWFEIVFHVTSKTKI
jgi:hypothetical protein